MSACWHGYIYYYYAWKSKCRQNHMSVMEVMAKRWCTLFVLVFCEKQLVWMKPTCWWRKNTISWSVKTTQKILWFSKIIDTWWQKCRIHILCGHYFSYTNNDTMMLLMSVTKKDIENEDTLCLQVSVFNVFGLQSEWRWINVYQSIKYSSRQQVNVNNDAETKTHLTQFHSALTLSSMPNKKHLENYRKWRNKSMLYTEISWTPQNHQIQNSLTGLNQSDFRYWLSEKMYKWLI